MKQTIPHILVFTDLDGTLLDHHSYSAKPASDLVAWLHGMAIAQVIPITSKTQAELDYMDDLPMFKGVLTVSENGSVIAAADQSSFFLNDGSDVLLLDVGYQQILDQIALLPSSLRNHIRGFDDMKIAEVVAETGLSIENARLAKQRQASEPFLWSGPKSEFQEMRSIMADAGIDIQQGGRFFHFTGMKSKVDAMQMIVTAFRKNQPETDYVTIALGDGPNDLAMIEAADFGVTMPNPAGVTITSDQPGVRVAPATGPKGWVKAVSSILEELGLNWEQS